LLISKSTFRPQSFISGFYINKKVLKTVEGKRSRVTRLGEISDIGRDFGYWAKFRVLGKISDIGRNFGYWAKVYFGQCLEKYIAQIFGLLYPQYQF
jgi:hypothetical protein